MINNTNESKISIDKKEEAFINRLLAIHLLPKVNQELIFFINTYEQDMIAVGDEKGKI